MDRMRRRVAATVGFLRRHPRFLAVVQVAASAVVIAIIALSIRGSFANAGDRLGEASALDVVVGCLVLSAYYLLFVVGWIWILAAWGIRISYPAALGSEMVSMLAKYVPGGVWTPAARVVAARRAGVTQTGLVTASILVEAGLSAVSGVLVFVVSLAWVKEVDAPLVPLLVFGAVVAVLLQPRIFQPLSRRVLRRFGCRDVPPLPTVVMLRVLAYYAFTWLVGGAALWFLVRAVGGHPSVATIAFLGGTSAVGAIVAVLAFFAPSGLGFREGSMYGLLLAVATQGEALGAIVLNRVAITVVEVLLLAAGGIVLRARGQRLVAREGDA
jgi:uncharacterized membrane protein YbhN (UPF0104 family)